MAISKFLNPLSFFITSPIYLMPRGPTPSGLSILSYRVKCASTYHSLQCSLLFVTCDVLPITSSKTFSSVSSNLVNFPMAEQAQSDAGDLDGLHDGPQDAPQDPAKPPTQEQYTRLLKELNEPDTPPPKEDKTPPQLQPERAKLLQDLLNAIPIASANQIARMLQVFKPQNTQPAQAGQGKNPNPRPQNSRSPPPTRVWGNTSAAAFDPLRHLLPQVTRKR